MVLKRACCGDERVWPWKGPVVETRECSPEKGLLWRPGRRILLLLLVMVVVVMLLLIPFRP